MLNRNKIVTLVCVGLMSTLLSSVAGADTARSLSIKSTDLDLTSDAGQAALQERVRGAVNEVCQVSDWGASLDAQKAADACKQKVLAAVTPQVEAALKAAQSRHLASAH